MQSVANPFKLVVFLFLLISSSFGKTPDSLWTKFNSRAFHDTVRLDHLNHFIKQVRKQDPDSALVLSYKYIRYSKNKALKKFESLGYEVLAGVHLQKGNIDSALKHYFLSYEIRKNLGLKKPMARSLALIGDCYFYKSDFINSLDYLLRSLKISETLTDSSILARTLNTMGAVYDKLPNKNDEALKAYERVLEINRRIKDTFGLAIAYTNIGNIYLREKDYTRGEEIILKAKPLFKRIGNPNYIALNLMALSKCYKETKQPDKAEATLLEILSYRDQLNDPYALANAEAELAHTYVTRNELEKAKKLCYSALKIARPLNSHFINREVYSLLSTIFKKQNKLDSAFHYLSRFAAVKDSIMSDNIQQEITKKQLSFDFEKRTFADSLRNEQQRLLHATEMAGKEDKIRSQKIIQALLIAGVLLLVVFAFLIFNRYKLIHSQKLIIEKQKEIVEEKQKEIVDSIHYANRIQKALLANRALIDKHLPDNFVLFKPKDIVSGDFYWATEYKGCFYIAACDSTGHGVPGAFMSLLNIGFLNEAIKERNILQPNEIFNFVREKLIETISADGQKDGMDAILLRIDPATATITYAAANNRPVLVSNQQMKDLETDKMPVGYGEKNMSFNLYTLNCRKGDMLYLYTDGFSDQFGGPKGKKFKYRQLNDLLIREHQKPLAEQKEILDATFSDWKGDHEQVDDVCVIGIRV